MRSVLGVASMLVIRNAFEQLRSSVRYALWHMSSCLWKANVLLAFTHYDAEAAKRAMIGLRHELHASARICKQAPKH